MRNSMLIVAALLAGCGDKRGVRVETVDTVEYRDRDVPIAAPCAKSVTRPAYPILGPIAGEVEVAVSVLMQDDRVLREYVANLEAAGLACGVKLENPPVR